MKTIEVRELRRAIATALSPFWIRSDSHMHVTPDFAVSEVLARVCHTLGVEPFDAERIEVGGAHAEVR